MAAEDGGVSSRTSPKEISMKRSALQRLVALMMLAMFSMGTLTACNTVAGAGKDIESAGDKIEDKAEDCKEDC
jgi:entericidin A